MPEQSRTPVERFNTLVFVVLLGALLLSFVTDNAMAFGAEVAFRVAVVVLVVVGLFRFRGGYFSHWTSYLAAIVAVLSLVRLVQVFLLG